MCRNPCGSCSGSPTAGSVQVRACFPWGTSLARYRKLTAAPQGPGGESWPARLLPIWQADDEIGCLDLESGAITTYDPSRMQDIHGGYWRRSFAIEHPSLAELMEDWLQSPTFSEQVAGHERRSGLASRGWNGLASATTELPGTTRPDLGDRSRLAPSGLCVARWVHAAAGEAGGPTAPRSPGVRGRSWRLRPPRDQCEGVGRLLVLALRARDGVPTARR